MRRGRLVRGLLLAAALGGVLWLVLAREDRKDFNERYAATEAEIRARAAELDRALDEGGRDEVGAKGSGPAIAPHSD